ncbi:TonB-dependent receptor [Dyella ginsengisoli]|uniref:TonB-dependent receptor n=1 Tax=Dyella ginsengisoli TaxID=363848 RepID=A0ABW8JN25_9GAMM
MTTNTRNSSQGLNPRRNALALALALGMGLTGVAYAQATTGSIFGTAPVASGESVKVTNLSNGTTRTVAVDSSGRYAATNLPVGTYSVSLIKDGAVISTNDKVVVSVGGGTEVPFASEQNAQNLSAVSVVASALPAIDVSSVTSSTVITSKDLQQLPVGRSAESIALLAPGTVQGSGFFGNAVSFGGSSVSENAYYINGYNTGEPYRNIGGFALPYGSIDQQQTLTGGYSAKYGRSDGGVINQIGKRGTNEWHFGGQVAWAPKYLSSGGKDEYYGHPAIPAPTPDGTPFTLADPSLPGTLYWDRSKNKSWETIYSGYVGGPLIKDKLYMFLSAEQTKTKGTTVGNLDNGRELFYTNKENKVYGKIDWNINENNILEATYMSDRQDNGGGSTYNYDYTTLSTADFVQPSNRDKQTATFYIGKYTSYIGDNATLSVEYGKGRFTNPTIYGALSDLPFISLAGNQNPAYTGDTQIRNAQTVTQLSAIDAASNTRGLRVDFDYRLGDHDLSVGIDNQYYNAHNQGTYASGPGASITDPFNNANGYYWRYLVKTNADQSKTYTVDQRHFAKLASMSLSQKAYYLQDVWQVAQNVQLNLGLRNDRFTNYNDLHQAFVDEKNQWEPRLGVSWDVNGDSSFKVYGNAGRYYLALPNNAAERAATRSTFLDTIYSYTGIDANGIPTGLTVVRPTRSPDGETGGAKDPKQVTARNLKAQYLDEYIVGFDKQLNDNWTYGAKVTYRDLKTAIDDECSPGQIAAKMTKMGLDPNQYYDSLYGAAYCRLINPGLTNDMLVTRDDGTGSTIVKMTQQDWGYLKGVKREIASLDLYLEHPFDGKWMGRVDYTYSHGQGNTEGQVRSDFGQGDVSKTEDWDSWQLMQGQDGELINNRKHSIRFRGAYQFTPEWLVSATALIQSGTPKECLGYFGPNADGDPTGYNNGGSGNYHWCGGKIVHPGDPGHTPWTKTINLGVRYAPNFADQKLAFKFDIYNVLNDQKATQTYAAGESGPHTINNLYGMGIYFQPPRYMRLSVSYDY